MGWGIVYFFVFCFYPALKIFIYLSILKELSHEFGSEKDKPSSGKDKLSSGKDKPSSGKNKPSSGKDKPSSGKDKPSSGKDKPSSGKDKPSSLFHLKTIQFEAACQDQARTQTIVQKVRKAFNMLSKSRENVNLNFL